MTSIGDVVRTYWWMVRLQRWKFAGDGVDAAGATMMSVTMTALEWWTHVTCVELSQPLCRVASCRAELPPRRTAYCSDRHARAFERDHLWFVARRVARRRAAYACQRCGFEPRSVRRDPKARRTFARYELRLEVNHVTPLAGAYRLVSCANHQANLEVLCHRCHLAATAAQRAMRPA